jgi:hypothetical protein
MKLAKIFHRSAFPVGGTKEELMMKKQHVSKSANNPDAPTGGSRVLNRCSMMERMSKRHPWELCG